MYVFDLWTLRPLQNVQVFNQQSSLDGKIQIDLKTITEDSIKFACSGYFPVVIPRAELRNNQQIFMQTIDSLTNFVIIANRPGLSEMNIPAAVNSIRLDPEFKSSGSSISRELGMVSSTYIKNYGGAANLQTIGLRGLGAEHTSISFDGIPLNSLQNGVFDLGPAYFSKLQRVDIYKGGSAALFGISASGGAVNMVPADHNFKNHYSVSAGIGSFSDYSANLEAGVISNKNSNRITLYKRTVRGDYNFISQGSEYIRKNNDASLQGITYNYFNRPANFSVDLFWNTSERGIPKQFFGEQLSDQARQSDNSFFGRLKWVQSATFNAQIYYQFRDQEYKDPDLLINGLAINSRHRNHLAGLQLINNFIISPQLLLISSLDNSYGYINSSDAGQHERIYLSIGSILNWNPLQKTTFFLSHRYAFYHKYYNIHVPSASIKYGKEEFSAYLSVGKNYRVPTFNDLYWQPGGNSDLKPESSVAIESGFGAKFYWTGHWKISSAVYRNQIKDMIKWTSITSSVWQPQNIASVLSQGAEFQINFTTNNELFESQFGYNFGISEKTKAEFKNDLTVGNQLPHVPREIFSFWAAVNHEKWKFKSGLVRYSFRYNTIQNDAGDISPAYINTDLSIEKRTIILSHNLIFNFQINNLFNRQQYILPGYPLPGRGFKVNISVVSK